MKKHIFAILVSVFLFYPSQGFAEVKEIVSEGAYNMGDGETPSVAESRALLNAKRTALEQWEKEFASEKKWRDKVAAHTAYVDPRKDDNQYSQGMSIFMSPGWRDDSYIVGGDITGGADGISHTDWSWSITKTHKKLYELLASYHADFVSAGSILEIEPASQ